MNPNMSGDYKCWAFMKSDWKPKMWCEVNHKIYSDEMNQTCIPKSDEWTKNYEQCVKKNER